MNVNSVRTPGRPLRVVVEVRDGLAAVYSEEPIEVLTIDYDVDGLEEGQLESDLAGERCVTNHEMTTRPALVNDLFAHFQG